MALVYVFPGQGSQHKGMGAELFDKYAELVQQADDILGYSIKELCLQDPRYLLDKTQYTQPALFVVNALSYLSAIEQAGHKPDYLVGHSLGEFNALFAAGAFDFITGLKLVQKRGELMSNAPKGAMAAVLDISQEAIREILNKSPYKKIQLANMNSPTQNIVSGDYTEIENGEALFVNAGARYVRLNVSAAFHSELMQPVRLEFSEFLSQFQLQPLAIPVVANVTADFYPNTDYANLLVNQITGSVRWHESISRLLEKDSMQFEEVGPGMVLTKLIAKIKEAASSGKEKLPDDVPSSLNSNGIRAGINNIHADNNGLHKIIFMYSGQGSHYFQMGKELYDQNAIFKEHMDKCDQLVKNLLNISIITELYENIDNKVQFDNIIITHPALFSFGYSLTKVLQDRGLNPAGVLGYSLGEYVAAVIGGVISLEDGIGMVVAQAQFLSQKASEGGMLTVLTEPADMQENPDLYKDSSLAGINYNANFVLSGEKKALENIQERLRSRSIYSLLLPVAHGFHSSEIDVIEESFKSATDNIQLNPAVLPIYSSAKNGEVKHYDRQYFWDVIRGGINFSSLIENLQKSGNYCFVDLSPTGTLSAFIRRSPDEKVKHFSTINQFGKNIQSIDKLLMEIC